MPTKDLVSMLESMPSDPLRQAADTISDLLARVKELEVENQSIMEGFRQLVKTNEKRYTALNAAREALEKWKSYFQANIPNNADQMEEQGEQFTEAWTVTDQALSQIQACEVKG